MLWILDAAAGGEIAVDAIAQEFPSNAKWIVWNKIDLVSILRIKTLRSVVYNLDYPCYFISTINEFGFDKFLTALAEHARQYLGSTEPALVTRERHRRVLEDAVAALDRAWSEPSPRREDILAEDLRLAGRALGRLTGRVDVEDILDVIFRDFCIGK